MLLETRLSLAGTPLTLAGGAAIASQSLLPHEIFFQQNADLLHISGAITAGIGALLLVAGYALRQYNETPIADTNPVIIIPPNPKLQGQRVERLQKKCGLTQKCHKIG